MAPTPNRRLGLLKGLLVIGGAYEMAMGLVMFFFIQGFFHLLGAREPINYLIFARAMGTLAFSFGLLLLLASRDPERYLLIPLVSILLRVLIQFPILIGCFEIPEIRPLLLAFGAADLSFALLTAYAVRRAGLGWKDW
jgi:hypothetical protein